VLAKARPGAGLAVSTPVLHIKWPTDTPVLAGSESGGDGQEQALEDRWLQRLHRRGAPRRIRLARAGHCFSDLCPRLIFCHALS